jgi:integrase
MAITDAWLKANLGKIRESVDEKTDRDGLSVRVSRKGKIVFQLRYRHDRKQCRVDIGTYPLVTLKQAREEAQRYKAELEKGHDPRVIKKIDKIRNVEVLGLEAVFNRWHDGYCVHNKKCAQQIKRSFEIYVFPRYGAIPPEKISIDNWVSLLDEVKKKKPGNVMRLLTNGKQALAWAVRRQLIATNTLAAVSAKQDLNVVQKPRIRSLTDDEIGLVFMCLNESKIAAKNKLFVKLCLIYGCRNGELRVSKKQDFNFEAMTWTVPPENHKVGKSTGRALVRPITPDTRALIEECVRLSGPGDYLFNNVSSNGSLSGQQMTRSSSPQIPVNIMRWLRISKGVEMQHWSIHDLRKTARTNFSIFTQPHIAEIMLGHKMPGEWGVYDHHLYLNEQAECLNQWTARLRQIASIFQIDQVGD